MFEAFVEAATHIASVDAIVAIIVGTCIGLVFGALPGLGGCVALAIMIPVSYGMESMSAMLLFAAIMGAVPFGGSISSILINTPGTPQNAATCFDGFPMTQRGEGNKALAISATASGLGAIFGLLVLFSVMPIMRRVVLFFGAAEIFMLILFGLVTVAVASRGNLIKGLVAGGAGILLSLIGYSGLFGVLRFTYGSEYLWDGFMIVPLFIGVFAISELLVLTTKGGTVAREEIAARGSVVEGIKTVFRYPVTFFRSSALGTLIGIIPGTGGSVANFLSYTATIQTSKHPQTFGTGDPEGVVAAEAANNAKDGGALIPAVSLGIPGNPETAVLLGAFILHGLTPGPMLIREHLDIVWALFFGLLIANILASGIGLMLANKLLKLCYINVYYIIPIVAVLCFIGAYAVRGSIWDVALAAIFGLFGYGMKRTGYPIVCLVIGFVLGKMAETSFYHAVLTAYGSYTVFLVKPISATLLILLIMVILLPFVMGRLTTRRGKR
ncbi:tripartite tricarboxylate transporter permease [Chloroflexota bacterium]